MNYDSWKCRSPDDDLYCELGPGPYDDDPCEDECEHEEYEVDWAGRASCYRCGHSWEATAKQAAADQRHRREYAEWEAEQYRLENSPWRKLLRKLWLACLSIWAWFPSWSRKPRAAEIDDEIPF